MISKKNVNRAVHRAIGLLPALPLLAARRRRRRSMLLGWVVGGIGVALAGGMAALMLLSPRTRHRALGMAKEAYGKVNDKIGKARVQPNGIGSEQGGIDYSGGPYSSGL